MRGNVSYSSAALDDIRAMVAIIATEAVDKLVEKQLVPDRDAHKRLALHKYITWWMVPSFIWGGVLQSPAARKGLIDPHHKC